ncbi:hypothetical protein PPL_04228 [Heterostelium album PN500]|uniref:Uncharacterized protein n=1 Tax=Heterostelium pallidum (strain ATCC 26659 / Pp 5 / PN500) TaxID=670386 RepID=D3B6Z7_HETP5|nr:hypothetical protein PPL_04228 [Heterostelium album PN500]EFA82540.1 hypothetical protein PPL_04228 [Heterostelium album PN500]|eukprot:XP_020434657.1 hypothetical protein PPL_04228 [Heterostelium album PN500]
MLIRMLFQVYTSHSHQQNQQQQASTPHFCLILKDCLNSLTLFTCHKKSRVIITVRDLATTKQQPITSKYSTLSPHNQ